MNNYRRHQRSSLLITTVDEYGFNDRKFNFIVNRTTVRRWSCVNVDTWSAKQRPGQVFPEFDPSDCAQPVKLDEEWRLER